MLYHLLAGFDGFFSQELEQAANGNRELHRFRNDGSSPVHKSSYNPNDPEEILSVRIEDENGERKTHHIYKDGTGTAYVGDERS